MNYLAIISEESYAEQLLHLAFHMASSDYLKLHILICPNNASKDESTDKSKGAGDKVSLHKYVRDKAKECQERYELISQRIDRRAPLEYEIEILESENAKNDVLKFINSKHIDFLLLSKPVSNKDDAHVIMASKLFDDAPCHVMIIRPGELDATSCKRILIPVAGGQHSLKALSFAEKFSKLASGETAALYISPENSDLSHAAAKEQLEFYLNKAGVQKSEFITRRVELSDDVGQCIADLAEKDYDLVLLGASNANAIRKALFGTIPDNMLKGKTSVAIAVFRKAKPRFQVIREKFENWMDVTIPPLERGDRISLYNNLEEGSRWRFDFFALIALATSIAALGLVINSAAVVIGAMLVAPLMTPILGAGLAIVQSNKPLVFRCIKSILYSYITAIGIGLIVGVIGYISGMLIPGTTLPSELLARGNPSILDMLIAFVSGVAASYCIGRPTLSAALPGVAIAAALVPPIATTGIALCLAEFRLAFGSAMLFLTNVVAIILGAAFSFYAAGIRSKSNDLKKNWVRYALISLVTASSILIIPLGSEHYSKFSHRKESVNTTYFNQIKEHLEKDGIMLIDIKKLPKWDHLIIEVHISSPKVPSSKLSKELLEIAKANFKKPVKVKVFTALVMETEFSEELAD